jgi:protein-tyrosine-phosphatase
MSQAPVIIFVCEHGAAKSILAAAYFNKLAIDKGSDLRAIARGTNPDKELSPQTVMGLSKDELQPTESTPQKLTEADVQSAEHIITFVICQLNIIKKLSLNNGTGSPLSARTIKKLARRS